MNLIKRAAGVNATTLVIAGFMLAAFYVFFKPVFVNREQVMQQPPTIPALSPIGIDLEQFVGYVNAWKHTGNPYQGSNAHPPLMHIFFLPATWVAETTRYRMITYINLLLAPLMLIIFPWLALGRRRLSAVIGAFAAAGLFSYGYQFELERGQFNLITMSLCLWSLYIFHKHPRWKNLAYLLFSVSIQLKMYTAIFTVFFVGDWKNWKRAAMRVAGIVLVNIGLLFALGLNVFRLFVNAVKSQAADPYVWQGNASIRSYTLLTNSPGAVVPIFVTLAVCLLVLTYTGLKVRQHWLPPELLLGCAITAILVPSVSHDYKMSFLSIPALLFFERVTLHKTPELSGMTVTAKQLALNGVIFVCSATYSVTLFSYAYKPSRHALNNNFLPLFVLLIGATLYSILRWDRDA